MINVTDEKVLRILSTFACKNLVLDLVLVANQDGGFYMIIIKKISFWLLILSLIICLFNLSGNDDKNLLLFLTSPVLLWLNPWLTTLHYSMENELLWQFVLYGIHLFTWLITGFLIDLLIHAKKNK